MAKPIINGFLTFSHKKNVDFRLLEVVIYCTSIFPFLKEIFFIICGKFCYLIYYIVCMHQNLSYFWNKKSIKNYESLSTLTGPPSVYLSTNAKGVGTYLILFSFYYCKIWCISSRHFRWERLWKNIIVYKIPEQHLWILNQLLGIK